MIYSKIGGQCPQEKKGPARSVCLLRNDAFMSDESKTCNFHFLRYFFTLFLLVCWFLAATTSKHGLFHKWAFPHLRHNTFSHGAILDKASICSGAREKGASHDHGHRTNAIHIVADLCHTAQSSCARRDIQCHILVCVDACAIKIQIMGAPPLESWNPLLKLLLTLVPTSMRARPGKS